MFRTERREWNGFRGWRVCVGPARGIATPAAWNGTVVFGGGFGSHHVYGVDARTGELSWQLRTKDDGPTAATLIDGIAFLNTESCTLEAVDIASGKLLWERWLGDPLLAQPAAADGRVFMVWPARGRHHLGAFEMRTGRDLWTTELAADAISAPVVSDGRTFVTTFDGSVTCVDAASGARLWTRAMRATSAPWVVGDDVYVARRSEGAKRARARAEPPAAGAAGKASATAPESAERPRERISSLNSGRGFRTKDFPPKLAMYLAEKYGAERKRAFAAQDASVGFSLPPGSAKMHYAKHLVGEGLISRSWRYQGSRPVVYEGVLYETSGDRLEATEIASGRVLWSWADAETMDGERRLTPPAVANGRVLVGTWDGRLVSLDAARGSVRWKLPVGAPVHWQPTMSGGRIFAGLEDGSVVCVETGDPLDDGWPMWGGGPGHNGCAVPTDDGAVAAQQEFWTSGQ